MTGIAAHRGVRGLAGLSAKLTTSGALARLARVRRAKRSKVAHTPWPGVSVISRVGDTEVVPLDDDTALIRRPRSRRGQPSEWIVNDAGATPIPGPKAMYDLAADRNLIKVLEQCEVNCVLDVGANVGQFATRLRAAGWRGRIVSFEPVPRVFEELSAAADHDPLWQVKNLALGRHDGEATIHAVSGQGLASSFLPPSEYGSGLYPKLTATKPVTVSMRRLGPLLPELLAGIDAPRVFLKLDTQGFDLEVFAGLGEGLDVVVAMQSEIASLHIYAGMPDLTTALDTYRAKGFDLAGCWPVTIERGSCRVTEFDAVMVRSPGVSVAGTEAGHTLSPTVG